MGMGEEGEDISSTLSESEATMGKGEVISRGAVNTGSGELAPIEGKGALVLRECSLLRAIRTLIG